MLKYFATTNPPFTSGDDDYFSSDLDARREAEIWSRFDKPFLVLHSAEDEYVPPELDKEALVARWAGVNGRMSRLSGCIPGANHTVDSDAARGWFARTVVEFLGTV
jgi:pimeloyl-ACP methyl ester carboxylesterase